MENLITLLWEMDKDQSFACLTVTPVKTPTRCYYECREEIVVQPYPNPIGFGGMWTQSYPERPEEAIAHFNKRVEPLKAHGLDRIEIKEMDEEFRDDPKPREIAKPIEAVEQSIYSQLSLFG